MRIRVSTFAGVGVDMHTGPDREDEPGARLDEMRRDVAGARDRHWMASGAGFQPDRPDPAGEAPRELHVKLEAP